MLVARARVSRTGKLSDFTALSSRAWTAVQSTLSVGRRGREIFASAMCPFQFAKASASTLSQQEKNDSADGQRGRVNVSGFICTMAN
jgi:hypothetical protein